MTKVYMGQTNPTPNDFQGNLKQILDGVKLALDGDCDLAVFPELCIPGYLVKDMVYNEDFIDKNLRSVDTICEATIGNKNLHVFVGYVSKNTTGAGKPFYNSVAVINNGYVIAKYNKWLLPHYDIFDESRYYEPGDETCVITINGERFGIACCEDLWNDRGQDDYNHHRNPVQQYRELGVEWIVSLNASPFVDKKPWLRQYMLSKVCQGSFGLIYVNQIGNQDEIIFDGHSLIMNTSGLLLEYITNDLSPKVNSAGQHSIVDLEETSHTYFKEDVDDVLKMILLGMYDYATKSGFTKFVLGSSGGIDSALVASLASIAFGGGNVHCIMMPSMYSSEGSVKDAQTLHTNWNINEYKVPIEHKNKINFINEHLDLGENNKYGPLAEENFQARIRGQIVMHFSNATGALALTTGNKTELCCSYFTAFGDSAGFCDPLGDLYKKQVVSLCKRINEIYRKEMIPNVIINKPPSAELAPGQTDEKSLMPYFILDELCQAYIENYVKTIPEFYKWLEHNNKETHSKIMSNKEYTNIIEHKYDAIIKRIDQTEYKRRVAPFCFKVSKKSFGTGRRIPICKGNG